jgi:flavin-dependent dehydrogenase
VDPGNSRRSDIVIVGAGPAGSAAAILLARRGWRVTLLDRRDPTGFKLCTHAIMPAGVAVLEELGLLGALEAAGATRWWGCRLWLNGVSIGARLPRRNVRFPYGLSLRRQRLDPLFLDLARQQPGVRVLHGWRFTGLIDDHREIAGVSAIDDDGHRRILPARLVVGADGRHSQVARAARLPRLTLPNQHAAWIAYIAGVPREERPSLEGYYWHGRSASFLPADEGLRVAGVMTPHGAWQPDEAAERMLLALRAFPPLRSRLSTAWVLGQPVHVSGLRNLVRTPSRPGVVLIGDATLQTDPAFGQGISWALQSAAAAAPAIDRHLRGEAARPASAALLGAFRRPQFLGVFAGTGILSAVTPGSWPERLLAANAAAGPWTTALAIRLGLSLVTASAAPSLVATIGARLAEALAG